MSANSPNMEKIRAFFKTYFSAIYQPIGQNLTKYRHLLFVYLQSWLEEVLLVFPILDNLLRYGLS